MHCSVGWTAEMMASEKVALKAEKLVYAMVGLKVYAMVALTGKTLAVSLVSKMAAYLAHPWGFHWVLMSAAN